VGQSFARVSERRFRTRLRGTTKIEEKKIDEKK
jgi:hypothetical protein